NKSEKRGRIDIYPDDLMLKILIILKLNNVSYHLGLTMTRASKEARVLIRVMDTGIFFETVRTTQVEFTNTFLNMRVYCQ
ncbi:MAG: hypothetical protein QXF82_06055, partial [Nitrososphaeria archaeon]